MKSYPVCLDRPVKKHGLVVADKGFFAKFFVDDSS
jgi:hypothetical protein